MRTRPVCQCVALFFSYCPLVRNVLICNLSSLPACNALNCHEERDRGYSCPEHPESRKFYFDSKQSQCLTWVSTSYLLDVCQPLFHRGCGGNSNQFATAADCKAKCQDTGKNSSSHSAKVDNTLIGLCRPWCCCWPAVSVHACNLTTDAKISEKVVKCGNGCPLGHICTNDNQCCPTKCEFPSSYFIYCSCSLCPSQT